uniref:SusC/RagA family TonB-linked outer membrane protein n=1 Tax=Ornithobacterium rhinotracheale TaxID=28251 RepID=UPI0039A54B28
MEKKKINLLGNFTDVRKKCFLLFMFFLGQYLSAQQIYSGVVLDSHKRPIEEVLVSNLNSKETTLTNKKGDFSIKANVGDVLTFYQLGFQELSFKVKNFTRKDFILKDESSLALNEFVVTGYKKIKNRVFTGAASQVKMSEIKIDAVPDVSRLLEGRVAGLNIQNVTGTFGAAPRINIRGGASINSNVQPLWVIDGAVYEDIVNLTFDQLVSGDAVTLISSAIAGINPSDIEDIQVLKDASATSMYGARALNGVIVITTKSGRRNTPNRINFSYEQAVRLRPNYNQYDLLNSQETMSIYNEMHNKGYFDMTSALMGRRGGAYHNLYKSLTTFNEATQSYALENTPESIADYLRNFEYANTDWFNELFRMRPTHTLALNFSGGGENSANYASLGYYTDGGWSIIDKTQRLTANVKNTYFISDKFKTNINIQGNFRNQKAPGTFRQKKNTNIGSFERDFDINPFSYALNTTRAMLPNLYYRNNWAPFNIFNEYDNNYLDINVIDLKIQGELEYKIKPNLVANLTAVARRASTSIEHTVKSNSNVILAYQADNNSVELAENIYLFRENDGNYNFPKVILPEGGIFNKTENKLKNYLVRLSLDYEKQWGENDLKLYGFNEIRSTDRDINPFSGYGMLFDRANQVITSPLVFQKLQTENEVYFGLSRIKDRGVTFSGNATYGYAGKYIINAVVNYEGANISGRGAQSRWLPTWNVGAKWNLDKEEFIQKLPNLNTLALRASYGFTAKMSESAINSLAVFTSGVTNRYLTKERENQLSLLNLENRDLTWEKMYEFNVGLDVGLFKNRWNFTIDAYQRKSFDLIDLVRTSGIGGAYYKFANFADMDTKGIEFTLNATPIKTQDFSWTAMYTMGYYDQKITRLRNTPDTFDLVAGTGKGNVVGHPRGGLYSFQLTGLDQYGLPNFYFGDYPFEGFEFAKSAGADFLDTKYSLSYLKYEGAIEPNLTGGFSNTFKYKNFDLSFFITYQVGNKIRLQPTYDPGFADLNVFANYYLNRWLNPGDEFKTNVPVIPSKDLIKLVGEENIERAYNTYNYSQLRVADGSFVRMKNISLGYTFSSDLIQKWKMQGANIRLQITNPFLIYSDKKLNGQDPEFFRSGGVALPIQRQCTLGINLMF